MDTVWQDLRYALRMMVKSPGFTAVAVLTLALGIGGNTAIFSVVDGMLLRPLPYGDSERLVFLSEASKEIPDMSISIPNYLDWKQRNKVFDEIAAMRSNGYNLTGGQFPELLSGAQTTANTFTTLGVKPILGRTFLPEEDRPGGNPVVLLSQSLWKSHFSSDRNVLGKTLTLDGEHFTVVGVMPSYFQVPDPSTQIWTSLGHLADEETMRNRDNHPGIYAVARLRTGVSIDAARADMSGVADRLAKQYPASNTGNGVAIYPLRQFLVGDFRQGLLVLFAAVGFVLLIACANVANLLLARAASREKEIAIRTSLGAGRWRLVRQLLTESVLLALVGGLLGILVARWGLSALLAAAPQDTPLVDTIQLNRIALLFTLGASLLSGILFGLAPALQASRTNFNASLKEGGRGGSGVGHQIVRRVLVVCEVALSLVLLVGAGLMLRSFQRIQQTGPGLDPAGLVTMQVSLPDSQYKEDSQVRGYIDRILERVQGLPGVASAGVVTPIPLSGNGWQTGFRKAGAPEPAPGQAPGTDIARVSADYFRTMRIPLLKGRYFTTADTADSLPVTIIDKTMADRYWPGEDPIGKQMRVQVRRGPNPPWQTIVGVVGHVKNYGVDANSRVETYVPYTQGPVGYIGLVVRTRLAPESLGTAVRQAAVAVDANVPIYRTTTMEQMMDQLAVSRRLSTFLLGLFAAVALLLASLGLYGVMSYAVTQRSREIGIRMAIGAQRSDVLRLVINSGVKLVGIGLGIGLAASLGLSRTLATMLFQVSPFDLAAFASVSVLLTLAGLLACYIPARRATKLDPLVALRYE
jgi:putative ABC transport system permease protein